MANEYDKILRENFSLPKPVLLRQLISQNIVSIRPIVPKVRQPILEREADTVADIITETGEHFLLYVEWQSTNDTNMAGRMAMYDLMLNQTYNLAVFGVVLYLGNPPLRMSDNHSFFDFNYRCKMIDVRQLNSATFLQSDDAGEVIFSILTGSDNKQEKEKTIQEIFARLQQLFADDSTMLRAKIRQLELLSLLRGPDIQKLIIQEEQKMPVTIDITKDLRYQQGVSEGAEQILITTAEKMFVSGMEISLVQNITGLDGKLLEEIAAKVAANRS